MGQGQFETDSEYAASQGLLDLDDLKSAKFGTGKDFRIWYTGGNARLVCADGDIQFRHATSYDTAEGGETFDPDNQEKMLHLNDDAGVECFYNDSLKFETTSSGAKVTGTLEITGDFEPDEIEMKDDKKIIFGDGDDLIIEHDTASDPDCNLINSTDEILKFTSSHGTYGFEFNNHIRIPDDKRIEFGNSQDLTIEFDTAADPDQAEIRCSSSRLKLQSNVAITLEETDGTNMIVAEKEGKSALYYDGSNKLETTSGGVECQQDLKLLNDKKIKVGYDDDLQIYHDTTGDDFSTIKNTTEKEFFIANSGESIFIRADDGKNGIRLYADNDGADYEVVLYHGGDTEAFRTVSGGSKVTGDLEVTATVKPNEIKLVNDKKIKIGYDDDLQIYHDTSPSPDASMIKNTTATELFIVNGGDESVFIRANEGKDGVRCWDSSESYKVGLFYDDTLKLETTNTGAKVTGDLVTTADLKPDGHIELKNDKILKVGYDDDLQIYHDTTGDDFSTIKNTTAKQLFIANSNSDIFIRANDGKDGVRLHPSGENYKVELFYNDSLRLETTNAGAKITGTLETTAAFQPDEIKLVNDKKIKIGYDDDLQIYHDTGPSPDASMIKNTTATQMFITNSNESIFIRANTGKDGVRCFPSSDNYKVQIFYDDSPKLQTQSSGVEILGDARFDDNCKVSLGNGQDLDIYWDGSKSWFNQNAGYFQFNRDIWPRYNHTSGDKQDLGDGDKRWDDVYCGDLEEASDGRYKDNIVISDLGLDFINKLTPRSYTKTHGTSGRTHYGLVAQEVEKVITDFGKTTKEFGGIGISEGGMYGLRYTQFLSPLIKAVQELSAEVETLKAEVAALKSS